MATNILFIFEGEKTECQITASLQQFFVNENTVIKCAYCGEIYQLYRQISNDEDLDSVLSAFPIFIHDYYGNEKTKELTNRKNLLHS